MSIFPLIFHRGREKETRESRTLSEISILLQLPTWRETHRVTVAIELEECYHAAARRIRHSFGEREEKKGINADKRAVWYLNGDTFGANKSLSLPKYAVLASVVCWEAPRTPLTTRSFPPSRGKCAQWNATTNHIRERTRSRLRLMCRRCVYRGRSSRTSGRAYFWRACVRV